MAKSFKNGTGAKMTQDRLQEVRDDLMQLVNVEVLVGFPEDSTQRKEVAGEPEITNAALGYIHDNGAPEQNIPARPFMIPGIESAKPQVTDLLTKMADAIVRPSRPQDVVERGYHAVGLAAQAAIRKQIESGIPPPLSEYTLRRRAQKGDKIAQFELDQRRAGEAPSSLTARPLMDTNQMLGAVNYAIRERKRRRKG